MNRRKKSIAAGILGTLILLVLYVIILTVLNSLEHVLDTFIEFWYWMTPLVIGFGIQAGLFYYVWDYTKNMAAQGTVLASGTTSTASMVACCAHHVTDFAPLLGMTAVAFFLTKYQLLFIVIGLVSNIIGILVMLRTIRNHRLYNKNSTFKKLRGFPLNTYFKASVVLGAVIILGIGLKIYLGV